MRQQNDIFFKPVTLYRPLRRHTHVLRYETPGRVQPTAEVLYKVIFGSDSTKSDFRKLYGESITKNLENFLAGKHETTPTTMAVIMQVTGLSQEHINRSKGKASGVFGVLEEIFSIAENIVRSSFEKSTHLECEFCRNNMLDDSETWWTSKGIQLASDNALFIDRFLNMMMGSATIVRLLNLFIDKKVDVANFDAWLGCEKRPIRRWLDDLLVSTNLNSFAALERALMESDTGSKITARQIRYWGSGENRMPNECAEQLLRLVNDDYRRTSQYYLALARTLDFLIDFLVAALPQKLSEAQAHELLRQRMRRLNEKQRIALSHKWKKRSNQSSDSEVGGDTELPLMSSGTL